MEIKLNIEPCCNEQGKKKPKAKVNGTLDPGERQTYSNPMCVTEVIKNGLCSKMSHISPHNTHTIQCMSGERDISQSN